MGASHGFVGLGSCQPSAKIRGRACLREMIEQDPYMAFNSVCASLYVSLSLLVSVSHIFFETRSHCLALIGMELAM